MASTPPLENDVTPHAPRGPQVRRPSRRTIMWGAPTVVVAAAAPSLASSAAPDPTLGTLCTRSVMPGNISFRPTTGEFDSSFADPASPEPATSTYTEGDLSVMASPSNYFGCESVEGLALRAVLIGRNYADPATQPQPDDTMCMYTLVNEPVRYFGIMPAGTGTGIGTGYSDVLHDPTRVPLAFDFATPVALLPGTRIQIDLGQVVAALPESGTEQVRPGSGVGQNYSLERVHDSEIQDGERIAHTDSISGHSVTITVPQEIPANGSFAFYIVMKVNDSFDPEWWPLNKNTEPTSADYGRYKYGSLTVQLSAVATYQVDKSALAQHASLGTGLLNMLEAVFVPEAQAAGIPDLAAPCLP